MCLHDCSNTRPCRHDMVRGRHLRAGSRTREPHSKTIVIQSFTPHLELQFFMQREGVGFSEVFVPVI